MERVFQGALNIVGGALAWIVTSEVSIFIARWALDTFGPGSIIFTFWLWMAYPMWWIWRQVLGLFV